jgi:hypothetical protein
MTIEESDPNSASDHLLDWLEGSISYLPSFLDDPYGPGDISTDSWWVNGDDLDQELINSTVFSSASFNTNSADTTPTSTITTDNLITLNNNHNHVNNNNDNLLSSLDSSKKRKAAEESTTPKTNHRKSTQINESDHGGVQQVKKTKRTAAKSTGNNTSNGGNNKDGRWAEQLLNPCASAITAGNLTRIQHLLYVLHELASPAGDANHRLAAHGLKALTHQLSSSSLSSPVSSITFASTKPKFFQRSLINFNDINPWFTIPNNIANSSILQIMSEQDPSTNLHILDIGVSHGVQWPTLLEALTRRSCGPPPLVRLTVIAPTSDIIDQNIDTPFATGPLGYSFTSQLLGFAKAMNINLQINRLDNQKVEDLNEQVINSSPDETLIVCAQFRLHNLNHKNPDNRTEFLKVLRNMNPKGVILSENNMECSCNNCGDFATGFSRRVEYLWRFLDSTSAAFKGRESEERRMMEGEAAKSLINIAEMNEKKEKWCERMRGAGFVGNCFAEDTTDGARALLRKYDNNWEMRVEDKDGGCIGLLWKGLPVSFSSLWKTNGCYTKLEPNDNR